MKYKQGDYEVEVFVDQTLFECSVEYKDRYDNIYFQATDPHFQTAIGVNIYKNNKLFKSALIGSEGGESIMYKNSVIIETNKILICCSDTIFCFSFPSLKLLWQTKADQVNCYGIYKLIDSYIVHGTFNITSLDSDGEIIWQNSGAAMFKKPEEKNAFTISNGFIIVSDCDNIKYKFDINGGIIK